ncbi:laminin subunit alpha [Ischnura elegans]|uniref:laminin subunit alpha n=1 Tax=Ischnura elegans TaxID=197161 RepID=UPI001ED8859B|nr:laminin subunit alpha [Ischnura elegans]
MAPWGPFLLLVAAAVVVDAQVLTPPYFNLAEGRRIWATSTCGIEEDADGQSTSTPELYCQLVGAYADRDDNVNLIQGQVCDVCDPSRPEKWHPPENAIDGSEKWWQSPPLSRGVKYNEVNLTIDLGQEFHVAYVFIKMANSPRPGIWALERSTDNGVTYKPWQYFSDSPSDCETYFGSDFLGPIDRDDSVICETEYSKVVPLEGGEIVVSLLNNRPSANDFFNSTVLQEWTRATNIRLRLLRTKTLLGHLMSVARQDPTVTRRYFYSIKDISIGGRCVCNGHADLCDITDPDDPYKLRCRCQHNTCGSQCEHCCDGYVQKAWRQSKSYEPFVCEPCNCFGHSDECEYDPEIDRKRLSLDIHGEYDGGGVCKNCRDNTEGINCDRCKPGFFRPFGRALDAPNVCEPCQCDYFYSTNNCAEGSGQCECKPEFTPPNCDSCSFGYFGYPDCRPCDCHMNGTRGFHCEAIGGQCPCKQNYAGKFCDSCADGFYNFSVCSPCECNPVGSLSDFCTKEDGQCPCKSNFGGRACEVCRDGYYNYPQCAYCNCDARGTLPGVCGKETGNCLCREGYGGPRCDQCLPGYFGYPDCRPCDCSTQGSASSVCDASGRCPCLPNFAGRTCDQCSPGYFQYPECLACNCHPHGAIGVSCGNEGKCQCKPNFDGIHCDTCREGFYNFPICEECNCDPSGVVESFTGCGSLPPGELCQCKEHVRGRICNECEPLYWNLQAPNPAGCEDCDCHTPGVMGGIGECDEKTGQCICKSSVGSRRCDVCKDGTYSLMEKNLFGCIDCGCDIGGSITSICQKDSGQCPCKPRIEGLTCTEPLKAHYFPTLHQYQFEAEDGRTAAFTPVRYGFNEQNFANFSWKGYAVFSQLQNEIIQDVYIEKSSIYRMVLRYVNPSGESALGTVTITPDNPSDIEQTFHVVLKANNQPTFVTVSGPSGSIPSPMVMNPGRWSIKIKVDQYVLLDYFVIMPSAFYEATILSKSVNNPCLAVSGNSSGNTLCRHFQYPKVSQFDMVHGEGGFLPEDNERRPLKEYFTDEKVLEHFGEEEMPLLNQKQSEIHLDLSLSRVGPYIIVINYFTPDEDAEVSTVEIEASSTTGRQKGKVSLYPCHYTFLCRQAVKDKYGKIGVFNFDSNYIGLVLKGDENSNVAIESIVAIPQDKWSTDYIEPKSACVRKNGVCVPSAFPIAPDSKKVEFELGNEDQMSSRLPAGISDNTTGLIYLSHVDAMVDVIGKVPQEGSYVFVTHYYQPEFPEFDVDVLVQNGQIYEASIPIEHCPSSSGCRSIVKQPNGNIHFELMENFLLTFKEPNHKTVWLDYVIVIPSDQFTENILYEEHLDQTGRFLKQCAKNEFHMDRKTSDFCREAVFSITSDYNNGALPCHCDIEGSLSFECEKFGGQCACKPNVIGRKCEHCKTGYYGFPDCRPCSCPSTAICDPESGSCICPPRVTGRNCDQCVPYTYGYDQIIGCEECNCNPLGVERGNLQCDLLTGLCKCKENVVGRTCDSCMAGFSSFPFCELCSCDLRGTTPEICDQHSAECFCKNNVNGLACDICKEGTFNIQEKNPDGCTKCFCFGRTSLCSSSSLYWSHVSRMEDWYLASIDVGGSNVQHQVTVEPINTLPEISNGVVSADLTAEELIEKVAYFVAPASYLGNRISSYGGMLNFTVTYSPGALGSAVSGADVILHGANTYLLHSSLEQPPPDETYHGYLDLVETNFILPNGFSATREQLMQALQNLRGIYIRASYWEPSVFTKLEHVVLDTAEKDYNPRAGKALSVEQCSCPPNYQGLSCEECAPGYYRSKVGSYGGFCVPCQCNGHADTCDPTTGVCIDCKHNTTGEHCEKCVAGFHGNATYGTPFDCLICACPLPIMSNNFAVGCDVSPDGVNIRCDCYPGYYGPRCEACAAGYYGKPEVPGDYCKPCECSGNINPDEFGSCDSVTGECIHCLNNTFGEACALCAPGYFGDAVDLKDCQSCVCDECGTDQCNSYTGECECHPNVVGEKCDRCAANHWGFSSCNGCTSCNCQVASESSQCDDFTGQCRCQPGVSGRTCDRCSPGYWNYGPSGCVTCGCNTEYSVGVGCNANTGQCECLPGVIGEKCDHCPYRWVLVQDQGCFECDSCIHDLLDVTGNLMDTLGPVARDFNTIALGFFTTQRLKYINQSVWELTPEVELLDPMRIDLQPLENDLASLKEASRNLHRAVDYAVSRSDRAKQEGDEVRSEALKVEELIERAVEGATGIVLEVSGLANSLEGGAGPKVDYALIDAQNILKEIQEIDFEPYHKKAREELEKSQEVLDSMMDFNVPMFNQSKEFEDLRKKIEEFDAKLDDLRNNSAMAEKKYTEAEALNLQNRNAKFAPKVMSVNNMTKETESSMGEAKDYLKKSFDILGRTNDNFLNLNKIIDDLNEDNKKMNETIEQKEEELKSVKEPAERAITHAEELSTRASELYDLLSDTRNTSENAVAAANAYKNIVVAIADAMQAAQDAGNAANNATDMSEGLGERTGESDLRSSKLLQDARGTLEAAQAHLTPNLEIAKQNILQVKDLNDYADTVDKSVKSALSSIPSEPLESMATEAANVAEEAEVLAKDALEKIANIALSVPDDLKEAKQIPKSIDNARKDIYHVQNQAERVSTLLPDINKLMSQVGERQSSMDAAHEDLREQIRILEKKLALARDTVNRIKVGVKMYANTSLELRNPEGLAQLGTSARVSTYFKTDKPNGFVLYLGNEIDTKKRLRRVVSDDFMALEIENGYPILKIDLGSGAQSIASDKYVADDVWYQAIIERVGKSVKLIIREESNDGQEILHENAVVLPGESSILNLDQNLSKLFVGSYPVMFKMQPDVKYSAFEGELEELMIGDTPVSFWNFNDADNAMDGVKERDKLVNLQPKTGFRFDGSGYAILSGEGYHMRQRSDVQLDFKTFAKDGLLFLVEKDDSFLSIEMRGGRIIYQFDLGSGIATLKSKKSYSDGKWHTVEAVRQRSDGILKVDGELVDQGVSSGSATDLMLSDNVYFGGYPGDHHFITVTNRDFDGCIDLVHIDSTPVDLSQNLEALGVTPGCPVKVASMVSFLENFPGFIIWPNTTTDNFLQLNFKFNSSHGDGLLFYLTDSQQSTGVSLSLVDGSLVMLGPQGRSKIATGSTTSSNPTKYNDGQWHVVTATYSSEAMLLHIDDYESFSSSEALEPLSMRYGKLYFGGVPSEMRISPGAVASEAPFVGCLGEATINGLVINFANSSKGIHTVLGKCVTGPYDYGRLPIVPPGEEGDYEGGSAEEEPPVESEGRVPSLLPQTTVMPTTPPRPIITTMQPAETPSEAQCTLPMVPAPDPDVNAASGYRFGTERRSRLEYSAVPGKYRSRYEFTIEFNTLEPDGVIFYVADQRHIDYISLILKGGALFYSFNCGSGPALITSEESYNDGQWHSVTFSRLHTQGKLSVDHAEVGEGSSKGNTKALNVLPPFFVGGISEAAGLEAKGNLRGVNNSFPGCLRNFRMNGKTVGEPSVVEGVIPCSEKVEPGFFFSAAGGFIRIANSFKVGIKIEIAMDIKPRNITGILMSVHGKRDFLVLQMVNGVIKFTVDNGKGAISAAYVPPHPHFFCDGQWHTISAIKNKNTVSLAVDREYVEPGIGEYGSSSTDTANPLFLGGHMHIVPARFRGIETRLPYVGCVRNVMINSKALELSVTQAIGNVTMGVCPTT